MGLFPFPVGGHLPHLLAHQQQQQQVLLLSGPSSLESVDDSLVGIDMGNANSASGPEEDDGGGGGGGGGGRGGRQEQLEERCRQLEERIKVRSQDPTNTSSVNLVSGCPNAR